MKSFQRLYAFQVDGFPNRATRNILSLTIPK
ncbi:hypothetical protein [Tumidithrix helvetica]